MISSAKIAGSPLFEVFSDNSADSTADAVCILSLRTGPLKTAPPMRCYVALRRPRPGGAFVTTFWQPVNRPIFDDESLGFITLKT